MIPPPFFAAFFWLVDNLDKPLRGWIRGNLLPPEEKYRIAETIARHDHDRDVPRRRWTRAGWKPLDE